MKSILAAMVVLSALFFASPVSAHGGVVFLNNGGCGGANLGFSNFVVPNSFGFFANSNPQFVVNNGFGFGQQFVAVNGFNHGFRNNVIVRRGFNNRSNIVVGNGANNVIINRRGFVGNRNQVIIGNGFNSIRVNNGLGGRSFIRVR